MKLRDDHTERMFNHVYERQVDPTGEPNDEWIPVASFLMLEDAEIYADDKHFIHGLTYAVITHIPEADPVVVKEVTR